MALAFLCYPFTLVGGAIRPYVLQGHVGRRPRSPCELTPPNLPNLDVLYFSLSVKVQPQLRLSERVETLHFDLSYETQRALFQFRLPTLRHGDKRLLVTENVDSERYI